MLPNYGRVSCVDVIQAVSAEGNVEDLFGPTGRQAFASSVRRQQPDPATELQRFDLDTDLFWLRAYENKRALEQDLFRVISHVPNKTKHFRERLSELKDKRLLGLLTETEREEFDRLKFRSRAEHRQEAKRMARIRTETATELASLISLIQKVTKSLDEQLAKSQKKPPRS